MIILKFFAIWFFANIFTIITFIGVKHFFLRKYKFMEYWILAIICVTVICFVSAKIKNN